MSIENVRQVISEAKKDKQSHIHIDLSPQATGYIITDLHSQEVFNMLSKVENLTSLELGHNNIKNWNGINTLKNLTTIFLSSNKLSDVDFLKELKQLTTIDLRNNNLSNIDSLKEHKNLEVLLLGGNKELEEILSIEVINDYMNAQRIINHYFRVKDGKPINEAKIIVVGEAEYGKTLLVNRLVNNTFIDTERTHGIIITEWKDIEVNDEKVKLNIWDFGGQKIMQNTHQYFFTERTIYILVLNARQNEGSNKTIEHLERIKSVAKDSPIIVVGNKVDQNKGEFDINRSELREKYNIKGFYGVCSDKNVTEYNENFVEFKESVIREIAQLSGIHKPFRREWFKVKNHLESLKQDKQNFIKYHDYLTFCIDKDVKEQIDQDEIVTFLNELGLIVYLEKHKSKVKFTTDDKLIFNPEWLISGVYAVIDNPQLLKRRAILDYETFKDILETCKIEGYKYQTDDYKYVLNMMLACKLCVRMKNTEDDYLIPDHLKEDKSEILKEYEAELDKLDYKLNFQFHYAELFDDIFRRFLIGMYDYVYHAYYWKTGVVLEYENCKALVSADNSENKIVVKIEGEHARDRQNLLAVIYKEFHDIHKSYPNLDYSEWVAHKDYPNIIRPYNRLISMERTNNLTEYCEEAEKSFPIADFLDNVRFIEKEKQKDDERFNFANSKIGNLSVTIAKDISNADLNIITKQTNNSNEFSKKLDEMFANLAERQTNELQILVNDLVAFVDKKIAESGIKDEKVKEYQDIKVSSDWKAKLKVTIPIVPKFAGIEFEKEWKAGEDIKPETFIERLRSFLHLQKIDDKPLKLEN